MPIDLLALAAELIANEGLEIIKDKARRSEMILKILNRFPPLKPDAPPDERFDGVYAYTLVQYGAGTGKPEPLLKFFRHPFIKDAFWKSFIKQDASILEEETENFLDWNEIGKELINLDYDPRREFAEFSEEFITAAKLTRTVHQVLVDQKLGGISTELQEIPTKVVQLLKEKQFLRDKEGLENVLSIAHLFNVPSLPVNYLERNNHVDAIKRLLLANIGKNVGITGISHAVGLQGMGGIGKSVLAAVVAHDDQIRAAFPDGIVWVQLGQKPNIVESQNSILENFDEYEGFPISPSQGLSLLKKRFRDKKILLILDDIWNIDSVKYFDVSFDDVRLLITTRQSQILTSIDAEECKVDILSQEQSLQLLLKQSKWTENVKSPEAAGEIAKQCGGLPLAISMIGAMLRSKPLDRWEKVLGYLENADLKSIEQIIKDYPHRTLFTALHVSVEDQPQPNRNCYLKLAVFPEDVPIPESVLEIYWSTTDLQDKDSTKIIDELIDASLIFRYDDNHVMLHDLQRDYVYSQCGDVQLLHQKMVDAYAEKYPAGWNSIPNEKPYYFERYFTYHLQQLADKEKSQKIAEELLNGSNALNWVSVLQCVEIIGKTKTPKQIAEQVIKTNRSSSVLCRCIQILKVEAKEDARRLLKDSKEYPVISVCLNLLGSEAKEDARRFLKESRDKEVINACLRLLGSEAKEDARHLLKESHEKEVISACLNLLGDEAKEDARRLLKERNEYQIISVCLNLLGDEAKEDARRLIKESHDKEVINACLSLLGDEAKEDARRLLKESHDKEVISVCLKLLGNEAKEDAHRLLKESKEPQVINVCLNLLGSDAKEDARRLLKESKNLFIQSACFKILGSEVNEEALEILNNWKSKPRVLVAAALKVFSDDPNKVEMYCRGILNNWEHDINFSIKKQIKKYSVHIVMSLTHPQLKEMSKFVVSTMLQKEKQSPGFLDTFLYKVTQAIDSGKTFVFGEEIDPQSL